MTSIPGLRQDETHPLHIYSGHLSSDPEAASLPPTTVSAHLFFVLVKARRTADRERVMFWFNVNFYYSNSPCIAKWPIGRSGMFCIRRANDGSRALGHGSEKRFTHTRGRLGRIYYHDLQSVSILGSLGVIIHTLPQSINLPVQATHIPVRIAMCTSYPR